MNNTSYTKATPSTLKRIWLNVKALLLGCMVAFILLEIILRIWTPIPFRVKGNTIILPANQKTVMKNKWIQKLDSNIYYSRNSIGLRGDEPPKDLSTRLSIITIGGSTTECRFLSDSCTWPEVMKRQLQDRFPSIWVNNAGLDGHSTFGHLAMLKDHVLKLKPKFVLFLAGANDVETYRKGDMDIDDMSNITFRNPKLFLKSLANKSEVLSLVKNFYRYYVAYKKGLVHKEINFKQLHSILITDGEQAKILASQKPFLDGYKQRLQTLITTSLSANIQPILITQPTLKGDFTDSATGIAMGNLQTVQGYNAKVDAKVLELYNDVCRQIAASNKIGLIDLAKEMPKNSIYYYDFLHFTNAGAMKAGNIIAYRLSFLIKAK